MAILRDGLARCPVKGCPVRYASGGDQLCHDHAADGSGDTAMARLAELAGTAPGYHPAADGGDGEGDGEPMAPIRHGQAVGHPAGR